MAKAENERAVIGDNGSVQAVAAEQLKAIVERVERLEEEKGALQSDIKDVYAEAKANGFDTKILRQVVRRRKIDRDEREAGDAILELYEGVFA